MFCKARWARRKKRKENQATKVTKNQKTKIWDEQNIYPPLQQYMKANSTMGSYIKILL